MGDPFKKKMKTVPITVESFGESRKLNMFSCLSENQKCQERMSVKIFNAINYA